MLSFAASHCPPDHDRSRESPLPARESVERAWSLETFRREVWDGLRRSEKRITVRASTGTDADAEHHPAPRDHSLRAKLRILEQHGPEIRALAGPGCAVVELGPVHPRKTRIILDHLDHPAAYVPVDPSTSSLVTAEQAARRGHPALPVLPVCADHTRVGWRLPELAGSAPRRLFVLSRTVMTQLSPESAVRFLRHLGHKGSGHDGLLLSVDHAPAPADPPGLHLQVLERANRELGTDFVVEHFTFESFVDTARSRVETRLVSRTAQTVRLNGDVVLLAAGEPITTGYSYWHSTTVLARIAEEAGLVPGACWTDPEGNVSMLACLMH